MSPCPALSWLSRRVRYVFLFVLCVAVLVWISTTINGPMRTIESQILNQMQISWNKEAELKPEPQSLQPTAEPLHRKPAPTLSCPKLSPHLRGELKLMFKPSLTLAEVSRDNPSVSEGQYKPADCVSRQSVAILIPHRNREKHLLYLLSHLHPFLQRQQLHYAIYIIHQAGEAIFNRAKLLNVGYLEALKDYNWDCFIFHDVDLVPENDHNLYTCETQPKHLVVGRNSTGYKLRYKGYFGGVTAMTKEQFFKVNGFSNTYWGWGGEDDDLRKRVQLQGMKIIRPPSTIARYVMIFHDRDSGNEVNKDRMLLLGQTLQMWKKDGLNSCSYKTLSVTRPPLYINITVDIKAPHSSL